MSLKTKITDDMKAAMRAGEKDRLGVIRLILAALKQREVDERIELDDALFADGAIVLNPVSSNGLEYRDQNGLLLALRWSGCEQLGLWSLPGAPFVCFEPWHGHPSPSDFAGELSGKPGGFVLQPQQSKLFELKASF